jgi:hypothetical protein
MNDRVESPVSLAELMVLIDGPRTDPHTIVFLALLELVVRGGAQLTGGIHTKISDRALTPHQRSSVRARPLTALLEVIDDGKARSPQKSITYAPTRLVGQAFAIRWGSAHAYVRREVWRALEVRLLANQEPDGFAVYPFHLTERGRDERSRLGTTLARDPDWKNAPGTALLQLAGLPLPSEDIFDAVDELEERITPGDVAGDDGGSFVT